MPGLALMTSCFMPPGDSGPAGRPGIAARRNWQSRSPAASPACPCPPAAPRSPRPRPPGSSFGSPRLCAPGAVVLEPHQLAVVEHARATEPELDRADRTAGRRPCRRGRGLADSERHEGGLPFPVRLSATHAPRNLRPAARSPNPLSQRRGTDARHRRPWASPSALPFQSLTRLPSWRSGSQRARGAGRQLFDPQARSAAALVRERAPAVLAWLSDRMTGSGLVWRGR